MRRIDGMTVTLTRRGVKPLVFTVPDAIGRKVERLVKQAEKSRQSIPAEVVLPELADDVMRPAAILRGARYRGEMTQVVLAERLGIRQSYLSEMEHGKRPIGKVMAKKLAAVFDCDYRLFL
jgi:ribosome-binding protein aMBF1 (putative translation factor)